METHGTASKKNHGEVVLMVLRENKNSDDWASSQLTPRASAVDANCFLDPSPTGAAPPLAAARRGRARTRPGTPAVTRGTKLG